MSYSTMEAHSLYSLNEFIRRMFVLNFPNAIWIRAEIAQVQLARGHCWLSLVEKDKYTDELIAQSEAIIWHQQLAKLYDKLGNTLEGLLQQGMAVQLRVQVDFHERYGLKLQVVDINPNFTLGQLEHNRRVLAERFKREGLLEQNKALPMPAVVQRLALISAPTAAGLQDFLTELSENEWGYVFHYELFPAAMQGAHTEAEVSQCLQQIATRKADFDCVIILRGGGARIDLTAFDSEKLCRVVATFPLPVHTAIGHEVDQTLLDMVAHTHHKTPTAAATWLIRHNMHFEMEVSVVATQLREWAHLQLQQQEQQLAQLAQRLRHAALHQLERQAQHLDQLGRAISTAANWYYKHQTHMLHALERQIILLHPQHIMARGYSLTTDATGQIVRTIQKLLTKQQIFTHLSDGAIESKIVAKYATDTRKKPGENT